MKTIFITGSSTGLGKATAKLFAANGWKVIATMRQPENEKELQLIDNITLLKLDVTDTAQIKEAVQKALSISDIDVVFNNAGYGLIGPLESMTDAQLTREMDTNILGVIRVTQAFIPHFRAKGAGLFLSTTSIGGLLTFPFTSVYHATKWAIEGWSESMSFELNKLGIGIKTIAPGGIQTDFAGRSLDTSTHPAYTKWIQRLYEKMGERTPTPADEIAAVVYEAATDGKDQLRYVAGEDAKARYAQRLQVGSEAFTKQLGKAFLGDN